MSKKEKTTQKGFNANQANKIVNENQKNKAANQKSSEKNRQQMNKAAEDKKKDSKGSKKPSGEFKFYFHG